MRRISLTSLSSRDWLWVIGPAIVLVIAAFWAASKFIEPAPPRSFVMTAGAEDGAYYQFAKRYKDILAREGVTIEIRTSAGSTENLARLLDPDSDVQVGFVQSGIAAGRDTSGLMSLGSLYYEPLWVFYRGKNAVDRLEQLRGWRIAVGAEGSGTRQLALQLLTASGVHRGNSTLLPLAGAAAHGALRRGEVDAVFVVGAPEGPAVRALLDDASLSLMNFSHAEAYSRILPFLNRIVLPHGAVDLARNAPPQDIQLVAPTATLVARDTLHPALVSLLLQAATEVHDQPEFLYRRGEFPSARETDILLSDQARRYYKSGPPLLQRYLPFWLAVLVDRLLILLIPLVAVALPLTRLVPALYAWRSRSKIYRLYGELRFLDHEIVHHFDPARAGEYATQLDSIEQAAERRRIPLAFTNELYILREHIGLVRQRLERKTAAGK